MVGHLVGMVAVDQVAGFLGALTAETGCAVASVEYRRVGGGGGGRPATFTDTARAADLLPGLPHRPRRAGSTRNA
ncbi:hypothetical protein [Streptomyces camelliae]|uniref:Thioesterase domain-containing protein n=1 Tax=Streptomyces camelliae TaxID=3004093 RepID=A0ABY7NV21_9ACTN|nr:hypothetical protein [Streptomyces sp. HUAS 2-6]WBO62091.1 hypothetical protein O1G22_04205 [Streptomyces sp. HUAS 2-6]